MGSIRGLGSLGWRVVLASCLVGAASPPAVTAATLGSPRLLADLVPGVGTVPFREAPDLERAVATGGRVVFTVTTHAGYEVWSSDGTALGTGRLYLGDGGYVESMWPRDGVAELLVQSDGNGRTLYRTDGTQAGTQAIASWPDSSLGWLAHDAQRSWVAPCFRRSGRYRCELWTVGATTATATRLAADLAEVRGGFYEQPVVGGRLFFFSADTASGPRTLWRSDGTVATTLPVLQLPAADRVSWLGAHGGRVLFVLDDDDEPTAGSTVWSSDGTAAGTRPLRHLPGADAFVLSWPPSHSDTGPFLFAAYRSSTDKTELWAIAGSRGPKRLGAFATLYGPARVGSPGGGAIEVFAAQMEAGLPGEPERLGLWATDGTPGGTRLLRPGTAGPPVVARILGTAGGRVFFMGKDSDHGAEPWVTDGTPGGTRRLADICPGACGVELGGVVELGGAALFVADRLGEQSLWRSDGTAAGTARVAALDGWVLLDERPIGHVAGGRAFFAVMGRDGSRLWTSDGSAGGTGPLEVGETNALGSAPVALAVSAGALLFTAADPLDPERQRVYLQRRGDALGAGVALPEYMQPYAAVLDDARGLALFVAGSQIWSTDGTPAGTVELTAFGKRAAPSDKSHDDCYDSVRLPSREGDRWLFKAYVCGEGEQLWSTDGTLAGTRREPVPPGASRLFHFDGQLYYTATVEGADGTALPQLFRVSLGGGAPTQLTNRAGGVYVEGSWPAPRLGSFFSLRFGGGRPELWVSDGTAGGTGPLTIDTAEGPPLTDIEEVAAAWSNTGLGFALAWGRAQGAPSQRALYAMVPESRIATHRATVRTSDPYRIDHAGCAAGVVFVGHDAANGFEPWISDGTIAGTHRLADLAPGVASSQPRNLVAGAGGVFFTARTPEAGEELWFTDCTAAGTALVADLAPGPRPSSPSGLVAGPDRLLFAADDGRTGREPWLLEWSPPAAAAGSGGQP